MRDHMAVHHEIMEEIGQTVGTGKYQSTLEAKWDSLSSESVDYGILEKASNIYVVKSEFTWSDVGSWNSYFELLPKKGDGNVVKGDGLVIDGGGNLIYSLGKLTTVMGLSDIAVINTDDATLIVPRDRVEEIKTIVSMVRQKGRDDLL
jgi:mannose-1-phosphate guanylyltransferase